MALTFTPDGFAIPGQFGCGLCGVTAQNLHVWINPETGQSYTIERNPGEFYTQMEDDSEASSAEINEHIPQCEFNPNAPQNKIP